MYKLEHGSDDKQRGNKAQMSVAQIEDLRESWNDDYSLNRLARSKFRVRPEKSCCTTSFVCVIFYVHCTVICSIDFYKFIYFYIFGANVCLLFFFMQLQLPIYLKVKTLAMPVCCSSDLVSVRVVSPSH
jgi:hypothetical protein